MMAAPTALATQSKQGGGSGVKRCFEWTVGTIGEVREWEETQGTEGGGRGGGRWKVGVQRAWVPMVCPFAYGDHRAALALEYTYDVGSILVWPLMDETSGRTGYRHHVVSCLVPPEKGISVSF
jgi:hypothetical protein